MRFGVYTHVQKRGGSTHSVAVNRTEFESAAVGDHTRENASGGFLVDFEFVLEGEPKVRNHFAKRRSFFLDPTQIAVGFYVDVVIDFDKFLAQSVFFVGNAVGRCGVAHDYERVGILFVVDRRVLAAQKRKVLRTVLVENVHLFLREGKFEDFGKSFR